MRLGMLTFEPAVEHEALLGKPVASYLNAHPAAAAWVSAIDATLADTAAFCAAYQIGLDVSANCVVLEAKRADSVWYAACVLLATTRADVNGSIRRELNARKLSFAPMDTAVRLTGMEYGGITPIGLPADWRILIDTQLMQRDGVIIGSGIRGSKILVDPAVLASLPNAQVLNITKTEA